MGGLLCPTLSSSFYLCRRTCMPRTLRAAVGHGATCQRGCNNACHFGRHWQEAQELRAQGISANFLGYTHLPLVWRRLWPHNGSADTRPNRCAGPLLLLRQLPCAFSGSNSAFLSRKHWATARIPIYWIPKRPPLASTYLLSDVWPRQASGAATVEYAGFRLLFCASAA